MADKAPAKLETITEPPPPAPAQLAAAGRLGISFRAFDQGELQALLEGHRTLGELQGIPKQTQYEWARTAQDLLSRGQLDKARELFLGLVALDPYDAYFHTGLGVAYLRDDQLDEALSHLSRALEINPFSADARASRAELYALRNERKLAVEDLVRLVNDNPTSNDPAVVRARAMVEGALKKG
jgi:tetratricopeptide (TPR) repeat protein